MSKVIYVLQKQFQKGLLGRCLLQEELGAAGSGDDFSGSCEEPVAPAFDVPGFGVVAVREGGELEPGDRVEGQSGNVDPGLVRGEVEERELAQAGVFQGFDPVLAPSPDAVSGVQEWAVPAG